MDRSETSVNPPPPATTDEPRRARAPWPKRAVWWVRLPSWTALISRGQVGALAVVAFVPQLLSRPGVVTSDTENYLYLDPGRFLSQATSMWDPSAGLGNVTHQWIGYLLPMGPFYWVFHALGVPVWVTQRLWVGAILFGAGAGVCYLASTLGLRGLGCLVAALAFMLSPYSLQYLGRESDLLLPWAVLPWMVALICRALRHGGWRYPACFALVVAVVGSINASSLIYVGVAPLLWILYAVVIAREASWQRAWSVTWRTVLLAVLGSLWWIAGLVIESGYGLNVLRYTETVQTISQTSTPIDVLRGLGYWYFYFGDRLGAWAATSVQMSQQLWPLSLSLAAPALAFVSAVTVRWRHRAFFVLLIVVGMVLGVGAYPFTHPTLLGRALRAFMTETTSGFALRSTDRASPLVILGTAMLLGCGVSALLARLRTSRRLRPVGWLAALAAIGVLVGANPPLWNGGTVDARYTEPASLPSYVTQATNALNAQGTTSRVLGIPGQNFAAYRYGYVDVQDVPSSIYRALLNRSYVQREQIPQGSQASADLLFALDNPIQLGTEDWNSLAPVARLMSVGDILVQNDLAYEDYDQPQPQQLWAQLTPPPPGTGPATGYGQPRPNVSAISQLDEAALAQPANEPQPSPLEVLPVSDPRPIVRAEGTANPVVVDGDAEGIVAAADVGLLDRNPTILSAGTLDAHPGQLRAALKSGAVIVLTDTNRKRAMRWNTLVDETGATLTAGQSQPKDPNDAPLDLFPGAPADVQTTASYLGVASVTASSYGDQASYLPEDRASMAVDGDPATAWETGAFGDPVGQWWQVTLDRPTTTGAVKLVQPRTGAPNRWITKATLTFDGGHPLTVKLGPSSRSAAGQTITFPTRTFRTLRVKIAGTNVGHLVTNASRLAQVDSGLSSVGLAEVAIAQAGPGASEVIDLPSDLVNRAATGTLANRLVIVVTRERVAPVPPRSDPEPSMTRSFVLPSSRTFALTGTARINALIPDDLIERLVGQDQIVATSSGRLPGDLQDSAESAVDGNPATVWSPGFGASSQVGSWLQVALGRTMTLDHLNLAVEADGAHSVPTRLTLTSTSGSETVTLPPIVSGQRRGTVVTVPIRFPPLTGNYLKVTIAGARLRTTVNYFSGSASVLPVAIAELGIPGVQASPPPASIPSPCRSDLLSIDGRPVSLRVTGSASGALAGQGLAVSLCGPDAGGVTLGPGRHILVAANGHTAGTGLNLDQLALDSAPGGGPEPPVADGSLSAPVPGPAPSVHVVSQTSTSMRLRITGVTARTSPFHLVLGESINAGWTATVDGGGELGAPEVIDGFANGWMVNPATLTSARHGSTLDVTLRWTPQTRVWLALVVSGATLAACLLIGLWAPVQRRRRRRRARSQPAAVFAQGATEAAGAPAGPDEVPTLTSPLASEGARPPWWQVAVGAVGTGGAAAAIASPTVGLAVGVAVALSLSVRHARWLLTLGAVALLIGAAASVVVDQATLHIPPGASWAASFARQATVTWAAAACLGADAVVQVLRRVAGRLRS